MDRIKKLLKSLEFKYEDNYYNNVVGNIIYNFYEYETYMYISIIKLDNKELIFSNIYNNSEIDKVINDLREHFKYDLRKNIINKLING